MEAITQLPSGWSLNIHSTGNVLKLSTQQIPQMQAQMVLQRKFPVILASIRITMVVLSFLWQWGSCQCCTVNDQWSYGKIIANFVSSNTLSMSSMHITFRIFYYQPYSR